VSTKALHDKEESPHYPIKEILPAGSIRFLHHHFEQKEKASSGWEGSGHSQCRKSSHAGDKVAVRPAPSLGPMRPAPRSIQYSACMPQQQLQANGKLQTFRFSFRSGRTTSRQHRIVGAPHPRCSSDCVLRGREKHSI
jgi:hypothetical protein